MTESEAKALCDRIRQIAYELHKYLGTGYLEFVIGEYVADMVVDDIVVELKSVSTLLPVHVAQTINYLKAMRLEHGMLINFGSEQFQCRKLAKRT